LNDVKFVTQEIGDTVEDFPGVPVFQVFTLFIM